MTSGLDAGADDCLVRPFTLTVLKVQLRAHPRRRPRSSTKEGHHDRGKRQRRHPDPRPGRRHPLRRGPPRPSPRTPRGPARRQGLRLQRQPRRAAQTPDPDGHLPQGAPNIQGLGKLRYVVEQTFALLHHFKRSAVRRERVAPHQASAQGPGNSQRESYAAATLPEAPRRFDALTSAQAELAHATGTDLSALALADLITPAAPPPGWRTAPSFAVRPAPRPVRRPGPGPLPTRRPHPPQPATTTEPPHDPGCHLPVRRPARRGRGHHPRCGRRSPRGRQRLSDTGRRIRASRRLALSTGLGSSSSALPTAPQRAAAVRS